MACSQCGIDHEPPFMIYSPEVCIKAMGNKIVELEGRLRTLGMECEKEFNRIHEVLKTPAKGLPAQDKDNMWTRRFK